MLFNYYFRQNRLEVKSEEWKGAELKSAAKIIHSIKQGEIFKQSYYGQKNSQPRLPGFDFYYTMNDAQ